MFGLKAQTYTTANYISTSARTAVKRQFYKALLKSRTDDVRPYSVQITQVRPRIENRQQRRIMLVVL